MILTVIGGGSPIWMQELMQDFYLLDEVDGGEIRLVDLNEKQVNLVADMLHVFNQQRDKDFAISVVPDRKQALAGADFVLATYNPGTRDAFFNDLEIPIKYGIRQPVSVTVGPPGISNALRTVPVGYEVIQDMEEVCPNAWMFNLTNPMTSVTRAMNLTPAASQKAIKAGAVRALKRLGAMKPVALEKPIRLEVDSTYSLYAQVAADIPGSDCLSGRTVAYTGRDMAEIGQIFRLMNNATLSDQVI